MVEGVEERAKSEWPSVMDGIGVLPRSESWLTCFRCDSVKAVATSTMTQRVSDPLGQCLLQMGFT